MVPGIAPCEPQETPTSARLHQMSPSECLAWERRQDTRHAYVNGAVFSMTGASRAPNLVCGNAFALLHGQLRGGHCEV